MSTYAAILVLPCSSFLIAEAIQGHVWYHINFLNICTGFVKYVIGILIGIALNLYNFG